MARRKSKKMSIKNYIIFIIILSSFIFSFFQNGSLYLKNKGSNDFDVHYIDVGQGDSTLLVLPNNKTILIDSGDEQHANKLISYIRAKGIKKLDLVVVTHPDSDHIGAMDKVLQNFQVSKFAMPDVTADTVQYKQIIRELMNKNLTINRLYSNDKINLDDKVQLDVLSPVKSRTYDDKNDYSIVIKATYDKTSFIFMGDASFETEAEIINNHGDFIKSDVLKVGHHGSSSSTSEYVLKKISPSLVVISCGLNNKYHHPHKIVLDLLKKYDIPIYRTDKDGDIALTSNGHQIKKLDI